MTPKITVYYDASCPLCASEMAAIKSRDAGDELALIDCSAASFAPVPSPSGPLTRETMLQLLHVRTANGRWLVGVPAYEAIFRATGFRRLAGLARSRRMRPFFTRLYAWLARNRHRLPRRGLAWVFARRASRNARAS